MKWYLCSAASFVHIIQAKQGQTSAGEIVEKLMMKHAPGWIRTSDPVNRSPALLRPAGVIYKQTYSWYNCTII